MSIVRSFRPECDQAKCKKCGICEQFCVEGTIIVDKKSGALFDYRFCKGCGVCANECPFKAITMVREN
jgi:2-oxoacid:acceptor oxidoreductase delta subunit (pyruvate/2-ketoisovalerate family)